MAGTVASCLRKTDVPETEPSPGVKDEKLEISKITDYLYLSGCTSLTPTRINKIGITCAVNCIKGIKQKFPPEVEYHYIPVEDEEGQDLRPYFEQVLATIHKEKERGGKTLIYCGLGISRSATFCIVYFMERHNMSLLEAYQTVQRQRSIICPNVGFFRQMMEREKQLFGKTTVQIIEPTPGVLVPDVVWNEIYEEVMQKMNTTGL